MACKKKTTALALSETTVNDSQINQVSTELNKVHKLAIGLDTGCPDLDALAARVDQNEADISDLKEDLRQKTGLSEEAKVALLDCFEHVAWIDEHGQDYYDALYDALYPDSGLVRITATFAQASTVIYPSTPLNDLKAYLTVTGYYNNGTTDRITDYALSGTLEVGTSTITALAGGKTASFTVVVSESQWDYEWDVSSGSIPLGKDSVSYPGIISNNLFVFANPSEAYYFQIADIGAIKVEIEFNVIEVNATDWWPVFVFALSENLSFYVGRTGNGKLRTNISGSYVELDVDFPQKGTLHKLEAIVSSSGCSYVIDDSITGNGPGKDSTENTTSVYLVPSNMNGLGVKSVKYKYLNETHTN